MPPHETMWNTGICRHLTQLARLSQNFEYRDRQPVPCPYSALKRLSSPTAMLYYCCCSSSSKQHYRVASHFFAITITSIVYDVISVMHAPPISSALFVRHTCMSNMYDEHARHTGSSYRCYNVNATLFACSALAGNSLSGL